MKTEEMCAAPPFSIIEDLPEDLEQRTIRLFQVFQRIHHVNQTARFGITKGEFLTLSILREYQKKNSHQLGVCVSDIAKKQHVAKSQVSRTLRGLEENGLIERTSAKEDRRNTYVSLTPKGNQMLDDVKKNMERHYQKVMEKFGEDNMENLIGLCDKLVNIIEEES